MTDEDALLCETSGGKTPSLLSIIPSAISSVLSLDQLLLRLFVSHHFHLQKLIPELIQAAVLKGEFQRPVLVNKGGRSKNA